MSNSEVNLLIIQRFLEHDYDVVGVEGNLVRARGRNNIEFYVAHERCMCHGGRLTIGSGHVNFYKRLESDAYDEELGITDAESELLYYINHKMFEVIETFESYVYKVVLTRPGYYKDKDEITYYNDPRDIGRVLASKDGDIFTLEEMTIAYPNPDIIEKIENVTYEGGVLEFDKSRYERREKDGEWVQDTDDYSLKHYRVSVINKRRTA